MENNLAIKALFSSISRVGKEGLGYHVARCFSVYGMEKPFEIPHESK